MRLDVKKTYKLFIGGAFPRSESETWCMWTDGIISCANCGALAEGLFVEISPVGA